jgi:hypothetical protein
MPKESFAKSETIGVSVDTALKHVGELPSGQLLGRVPKPGLLVTLSRPSQTPLVVPGRLQRCVLAIAHQVTSFVKQYRSALSIVDRHLEKFRVECDDLEGEISGSVGVAMANVPIPPIVRAAEDGEVFEDESLAIEALLLQKCDCLLDLFALVGLKFV